MMCTAPSENGSMRTHLKMQPSRRTDVGTIGYYADRAMIDFLGILQLDVAQA